MSAFVQTLGTLQTAFDPNKVAVTVSTQSDPLQDRREITLFVDRDRIRKIKTFSNMEMSVFVTDNSRRRLTLPGRPVVYYSEVHGSQKVVRELKICFKSDIITHYRLLLRKLLFNGIRVSEWFLLYHVLETNLKEGVTKELAFLYGLLSLASSSLRQNAGFKSHTKRIDNLLSPNPKVPDTGHLKLQEIMKTLMIPISSEKVSKLICTEETEVLRPLKTPKPENRIGVGYKDKGVLPKGSKDEPLSILVENPPVNSLSILKEYWSFFLNS